MREIKKERERERASEGERKGSERDREQKGRAGEKGVSKGERREKRETGLRKEEMKQEERGGLKWPRPSERGGIHRPSLSFTFVPALGEKRESIPLPLSGFFTSPAGGQRS